MPEELGKDRRIAALEVELGKVVSEKAALIIENADLNENIQILRQKIRELL